MRILYLVPYTPTPIRTRPYNLLRALLRGGHQITLATLTENQDEQRFLQEFAQAGLKIIQAPLSRPRRLINLAQALVSGEPLQARYSWNSKLFREIISELTLNSSTWDIIHVEHLRGARYGSLIRKYYPNHKPALPVVWDSVDSISLLFEQAARSSQSAFGRWVTRFELPRTRRYERRLANSFDQVLVTSSLDRDAFRKLAGEAIPLSVLPNGVDLEHFAPGDRLRNSGEIIFTGKLSYHANITAALYLVREIMPFVWKKQPSATVQLVGKDPPASLRELPREDARIQVTGTVADMRPYLQGARLSVAPLPYGAGIQNKVLEAMACGTPVVANSQAVSALQALPGKEILVADTPQRLAECILALLADEAFSRAVGEAGRAYAQKHHDWNAICSQLENIYLTAIERQESTPPL